MSQALRILRLLQEHGELGVSEIARTLGVGSSTAHRLLATLVDARFVRQAHSGGKYKLGPDVRLGGTAIDTILSIGSAHMASLRDETSETVHLAVLRGRKTHFLVGFESPRIMRVTSRVGQELPAHATAAGKLLLSTQTDAQVRALYSGVALAGGAPGSIASVNNLIDELQVVRRAQFGRNLAESEVGVAALAVPLRDSYGDVVAALTVTGPDSLFNPSHSATLSPRELELIEILTSTAHSIQTDLAALAAPSPSEKS